VLEEGRVALDLAIPYPHPRRHGNPALAELEGRLLSAILGTDGGH
jgi:sulfonate transport system ATP-binding protein